MGPSGEAHLARADGELSMIASRSGSRSRFTRRFARSPLRVLTPTESRSEALAVLVNTTGGLCGGDRIATQLRVEDGAEATVTTQAAERAYRARDRHAQVAHRIDLGSEACLHFAPQETILFDGSRMQRRLEIQAHPSSRFLAAETLVLGRQAMGERIHDLSLRDDWRISRAGRLRFADCLRLDGDLLRPLHGKAGFGGCEASCTLVAQGPSLDQARDLTRTILTSHTDLIAGATVVSGLLVARVVGSAQSVRRLLHDLLPPLRETVLGLTAALPRVWFC